jgi:hypothetical protein
MLKWKLVPIRLEIVLILTQDRCIVCAEHTIGSEIILDAPNGTPTRLKWKLISACLEIVLILGQDCCMVCAKRTIGLEIILGAPDGTPR